MLFDIELGCDLVMRFVVLTIFPEMFDPFWDHGIIRRAIDQKKIFASTLNIRDHAADKHQVTDDKPYGGGSGMVMKPEPLAGAIRVANRKVPSAKTILLTPQGRVFNQKVAHELAAFETLPKKTHSQTVCWNTRIIRAPRHLKVTRCRRSCCRVIIKKLKIGDWNPLCCARY